MASLVIDRVSKQFGDTPVIHDLSLEVGDGDFVVLVGPSGCGKSTLLRMIAGLDDVTRGAISIDGRRIDGIPPSERDIAMVFQSYALYPNMTVRKNIGFGLRLRGTPAPELEERVREVADTVGIGDLLDRLPRQLSGGQRQRVAMARAIVRRPAVFLFDEPLSNLDAKLRVHMRAEIAKLHRRLGTTTIYVTHDQVEAMTLASTIVVLDRGRLQQVGEPMALYREPANRFVAGFLGSPAMAFFDVELGDGGALRGRGFELPAPPKFRGLAPGRSLVLGVRPEHVVEAPDGALDARIELVERLGADVQVVAEVAGQPFTARVAASSSITAGNRARFAVAPEDLYLFDRATGEALAGAPA
jgi:multiple sugar transport system ATP-binding protein